jgi:hypothetical protein
VIDLQLALTRQVNNSVVACVFDVITKPDVILTYNESTSGSPAIDQAVVTLSVDFHALLVCFVAGKRKHSQQTQIIY